MMVILSTVATAASNMNYLVITLLTTIFIADYTKGVHHGRHNVKDSNSSPQGTQVQSATLGSSADNTAVASNQGWSPANSYLPASRGVQEYQGPMILSDGTIAETAEVAAARATHLAALEAARASDPDMGRDDGEYDPQKYGDHLYGVVAHSEDLLQSILSYQDLAQRGGVPAPVFGAPGAGMQSLSKAMSDASSGGAMYGAPAQGVGGPSPAPVYGPPATGSSGGAAKGSEARGGLPAPVYGPPSKGLGGDAAMGDGMRGPLPAPGYGGLDAGVGPMNNMPYTGPLAMLQLLASGYLADTPEVVAARNTHLKALLEAQAAAELWRTKQASSQARPWG